MRESRLEAAAWRQCAGIAACRETLHQRLVGFEAGHDVAQPDVPGRAREDCAAAATSSRFEIPSPRKGRDHLGQMVARDVEFVRQFCRGERSVGVACHAHQDTQAEIGERGEAQGRGPDLVIEVRI